MLAGMMIGVRYVIFYHYEISYFVLLSTLINILYFYIYMILLKDCGGCLFSHLDVLAEIYVNDRATGEEVETIVNAVHKIKIEEANPMPGYIGVGPNVGDDDRDDETQSAKRTGSSCHAPGSKLRPGLTNRSAVYTEPPYRRSV